MSNEQGRRMEANCRIIWGSGDYYFDEETDDHESYQCVVTGDDGELLTMTMLARTRERAWDDLDKKLDTWARQKERDREILRNKKAQSSRQNK